MNGPLLRLPDELGMEPSLRVLDIGCGRASVLRFMDGRVGFDHPPVGLDFSRTILRHAQRDAGTTGPIRQHPAAVYRRLGGLRHPAGGQLRDSHDDAEVLAGV